MIARFIVLLVFLGTAFDALAELEGLRFKYKLERERIEKPLSELRERFDERMAELKVEFSEAGNLEGAMSARKAVGVEPVEGKLVGRPPEIREAQRIYLKEKAARDEVRQEKLVTLDRAYHRQLVALRVKLTQAGDIAAAEDADREAVKVLAGMPKPEEKVLPTPLGEKPCRLTVTSSKKFSVHELKAKSARLSGGYRPVFDSVSEELEGLKFTRVPWTSSPEHTITAKSDGYCYVFVVRKMPELDGDFSQKRIVRRLVKGAYLGNVGMYRVSLRRGQTFSCKGGECGVIAAEIEVGK